MSPTPLTQAGTPPVYNVHRVGVYGGEPSITSDVNGVLYATYLGTKSVYRSTNRGASWALRTVPDPKTGDDCVATDQSGAVYWCNLNGTASTVPLQADVWKSIDQGQTWMFGQNAINEGTVCSTSCIPFGVDRQWVDAYIAPGGTTASAEVVLFYHDFYGPSHVWVNISHDGGMTFGAPQDILLNLNTLGSSGGQTALLDSACSTIPTGVQIVKHGPHKGRIFASWLAADPSSFLSGCNITQAQAFHNLIVAWSDDNGATWIPQVAYDAGLFHDASSPFATFTLDDQGNPYIGFVNNLNWTPNCAVPANTTPGPACEFDMYVVWSPDGGPTWKGPFKVNSSTGTHWFPAIAAGDPGMVDVAWLETSTVVPTGANGKDWPGMCYPTATCTNTNQWFLWAGQSLNLASANPTWTTTKITPSPMHVGDICNLGIACPPGLSNRNLADFIMETIDPQGCAHIAFADDQTTKEVDSADQVAGTCLSTSLLSSPSPTPLPNTNSGPGTPWPTVWWATALLPPAAIFAALGFRLRQRRKSGRAQ
ncbi:MAG TPA: sialidase family protein [Candidatus Dormibacteraeota bacterium]|nr:sialidase family protein [Candidatus Dormibacteraeota bacterium]